MKVSAIKCENYDRDSVFDKVKESITLIGGLSESLTKTSKVLIKPNLLTAKTPEKGITTHPEIVRAIIKILKEKGIVDITIGDSPAGKYSWGELWDKTGFANLAQEENIKLLAFENSKNVKLNNKYTLPILKELSSFDFVINVPKLKTHTLTKITGAVKNCYGLMIGGAKSHFHGKYTSPKKMSAFLAEFYELVKPDLTIMDAITGMEGDGPYNGPIKNMKVIFASNDAVSLDVCACEIYGYKYTQIPLLAECEKLNLGIANFAEIERLGNAWKLVSDCNAKKSKTASLLHCFPERFFHLFSSILSCKPTINEDKCKKCKKCFDICPQKAINLKGGTYIVNKRDCILCMCCTETCPENAIELLSIGMKLKSYFRIFRAYTKRF